MPDTLHTLATDALERCCEERDEARAEVERLFALLNEVLEDRNKLYVHLDDARAMHHDVLAYLDTHRAVLRQDFAADAEGLELAARIKENLDGETR